MNELTGIPMPSVFLHKTAEQTEAEIITGLRALRPDVYKERLQDSDPAVSLIKSVSSELSLFRSYANEIARTQFVASYNDMHKPRRRFGFSEEYRSGALEIVSEISDELSEEEKLSLQSQDVFVDSDREGRVILWVLSKAKNGETHEDLTKKIEKILNQEDQKIKTDTIIARSAVGKEFNLRAKIWLYPRTPQEVFKGLEKRFRDAFSKFRGFGKDVNLSWISSVLHVPGVQNVDLSGTKALTVSKNECAWLNQVDLGTKEEGRQT